MNCKMKLLSVSAVSLGLGLSSAAIGAPLFNYSDLAQGYQNSMPGGAEPVTDQSVDQAKNMEGKCGEGKCGTSKHVKSANPKLGKVHKHAMEGKCGEGKCGEGKCGEGKCGADKMHEGKCGEGKCGGTMKQDDASAEKK